MHRKFKISNKEFAGLVSLVGQMIEVSLMNGNSYWGKLLSVDNGMVSILRDEIVSLLPSIEPDRIIVFDLRNLVTFDLSSKDYVK